MSPTTAPSTTPASRRLSDPETWLAQHGDILYRYALPRLRDPHLAEEAVQETLVAALQARTRFSGRSSERTWLVGILKHKIIDHFRRTKREQPMEDLAEWSEARVEEAEAGIWPQPQAPAPQEWGADAPAAIERKEFQAALADCLTRLPRRAAEAFALRELEELSTAEICKALGVTPTNVWVMLHRARAQLRQCLETKWFGPQRRA